MKSRLACRALGAAAALALLASACGGGGGAAAAAAPTSALASASNLTYEIQPSLTGGNTVAFSWSGASGASDYLVEVGSASGANDVGPFTTATTSFSWTRVPTRRTFHARVRARSSAGTSGPSNEVRVVSFDLREAIDALWFGSGSLIPADGFTACVAAGRWVAFPPGATVRVRVSSVTVSAASQQAVQRAVQQSSATSGATPAIFELTGDPDPQPEENEITVATHPDPIRQGCTFERGCVFVRLRSSVIVSARALLGPGIANANAVAAYPHDAVGHGLFAYCHIDGQAIGGARHSLMGGGPNVFSCSAPSDTCIATSLSPLDAEAARAVYASGLLPGATRQDFIGAGLVAGQAAAASSPTTRAPRRIRVSATDEIVVIEHP